MPACCVALVALFFAFLSFGVKQPEPLPDMSPANSQNRIILICSVCMARVSLIRAALRYKAKLANTLVARSTKTVLVLVANLRCQSMVPILSEKKPAQNTNLALLFLCKKSPNIENLG